MKIQTKLTLLPLISIILVIAIGLIMNLAFNQINGEINKGRNSNELIKGMFELNIVTYQYLVYHEKRMQSQWLMKYDSLGKLLEKIMADKSLSQQYNLASIKSNYEDLNDLFSQSQANSAKRKMMIAENRPRTEINNALALEDRLVTQMLVKTQQITSWAFEISNGIQQKIVRLQQTAIFLVLFSVIGFIVLSSCLSFFVIRAITRPIKELVNSTRIIGAGDFGHRIEVRTKDEIGRLSVDFNDMVENLQKAFLERERHNWISKGQSAIDDQMRGDLTMVELCSNIMTFIANYLKIQVGTLYVNDGQGLFKLKASYAYKMRKDFSNEFKTGEGFIGQAALDKESKVLTNVPEDYITVVSGIVEKKPQNILIVPFVYNEAVSGVMELGSFDNFNEQHTLFLEQISEKIAIAINSAAARQQLEKALEKTQRQAEEMEAQQEELRVSNERLEEQARALKVSEEKLKLQQEELQVTIEELEEKTESLERQETNR